MRSTVVFNIVGLTPALVGEHTPNLQRLAQKGGLQPLRAVTPAVTCAAQATYLTGSLPSQHGIVGNGWFFRELSEIWFWRQSNKLVGGEWVWEAGRKLLPWLELADLTPDQSGVRAKLVPRAGMFRDFVVAEESPRGMPGWVTVAGIESPGLTAGAALAEEVERVLLGAGAL